MDDDVPFAGELDGAHLEHAGARASEFEHVVIGNLVELLSARAHARIGGEDAFDVGIDLAHVGVDSPGHSHCRRVGTAATERGHVIVVVDALKARNHGDDALVDRLHDAVGSHADDFRLVVRPVRADARLAAREAHGVITLRLECHGQKRHRHLLASRKEAVKLARWRVRVKRVCKSYQLIGRFSHRRDDGDHIVARLLLGDELVRDHLDTLGRRDRRPPEFAYD